MMGSGTGCTMPLRTACNTVRHMGCCVPPPSPSLAACSRAAASSKTTVAPVSKIRACTEISVNSVTSPASPNAKPTSGTPIMMVLLKVLARPRAAARVLKPCTPSVAAKISPAAAK